MEIVSDGSVAVVAEELGVDAEAVQAQVAAEVEYKLRQLVQDAAKFMRRSRRQRLTTADVEHALRVREWPLIHGFGYADAERFKFKQYQNLFYLQDQDVDLSKIMEDSEKLLLPRRAPLKPSFGIHWLAVDGVQPSVAENPQLQQPEATDPALSAAAAAAPPGAPSGPGGRMGIAKHLLSRELQIYYDKVVFAVVDSALGNRSASEAVYASLSSDPGLQQLMPYLSKFVFDQVNKSLCNLSLLFSVMRLTRCILVNPNLNKELYLHQMMPPIMTCIVHRRLCASPFMDHWALRDFAATLIPLIYSQYGAVYKDIQPRVTRTLRDALVGTKNKTMPLTTQYGAIVGLAAMGPLTVQAVLLPLMRRLFNRYHKVLKESSSVLKRAEASCCVGALQRAFGKYLRACSSSVFAKAILLEEHLKPVRHVMAMAGEATLPWAPREQTSSHLQMFL